MEMEGVEREREEDGGGNEGGGVGGGGEVDYDVAEEDERWMVS